MDQGLQATQISAGGTYTACPDAESPHADDSMGKLEVKKKEDLKMYSRDSRNIKEGSISLKRREQTRGTRTKEKDNHPWVKSLSRTVSH